MSKHSTEYNPLDYDNLTRNCVQELMTRGPFKIPIDEEFTGAGVYALFYIGDSDLYAKIKSPNADWPIYVGKAVPSGARKGAKSAAPSKALSARLREHTESIKAGAGLRVEDFLCRYLVVTPLWITMAERFLIEYYQPVWNVCIEGFGNHDPGAGRREGERPWWDTLHPGRAWAAKLKETRTQEGAKERLRRFLETQIRQITDTHAQRATIMTAKVKVPIEDEDEEEDEDE